MRQAKKYYYQVLKICLPFFFIVVVTLFFLGRQVMSLFTDEQAVIDLVMTALYFQLIGAYMDMTVAVLTGVVRALGL